MSLLMISTARKLKMMMKNNSKLILLTHKKYLMKFICNLILGLTILSTSLAGYSQKKNITDAAMLMKNTIQCPG